MIRIDSRFDVVLTYSPIIEITGHIFECFDYYLFLKQFCKVGILFFKGLRRDALKVAFESKYFQSFNSIEGDLVFIDDVYHGSQKTILAFGSKTRVLIADGNIRAFEYFNLMLATSKLYGFRCENDNAEEVTMNSHITYLQDYRVHGNGDGTKFKTLDYVKKLPFKFYRKARDCSFDIGMMYITYVCRKVTPDVIQNYHQMSGCKHTFVIVPYALPEYDKLQGIIQVTAPVKNLFDKFGTYIYTPVNRKFDCSPRLVTECFFQQKRVFKQLDYYDVGLETRFNDCVNNLQSLNLDANDKILDILRV